MIRNLLLVTLLLVILALILAPEWHKKNASYKLNEEQVKLLTILGDSAIQTLDVPVAALVLYDNKIIGRGYNTVNRSHNISGHAEINAISDAINRLGVEKFNAPDRKQVYLITTF